MEHVTACYWQKETPAELFLSLQQRKYRRLGISVVCACISDNGELVRSLQNKMEEELEEENVWRPFRTISTIDEINRLYSEAVRNRSQIMPGRTFKRKKNKAKGRTHFNNQKVSF